MRVLILIATCLLPACAGSIKVNNDGSCEVQTARTVAVSCNGATIITGKVALSDETIQILANQVGAIYEDKP